MVYAKLILQSVKTLDHLGFVPVNNEEKDGREKQIVCYLFGHRPFKIAYPTYSQVSNYHENMSV